MRGVVVTEFWKKSCRKWCFVACSKFQSNFTPLLIFKNQNLKKNYRWKRDLVRNKKRLHIAYCIFPSKAINDQLDDGLEGKNCRNMLLFPRYAV